ncbi:hypothetical protein [Nocardia neocaledoniensis]|uniref:hypothetical protein n=1 Tax=Nocardia neocaledoniensis TaxID=236511 RepID=UPI002456C050|nr:hypothetical protein [Nocardia neocaledoniensis]
MRSVTVGAVAVGVAAALACLAGPAAADNPAEPNEVITIDLNVLGCSIGAGLGGELAAAFTGATTGSASGSSSSVDTGLATRLRAAGCLPWK